MALVIGNDKALQSFELAFKSAWAGTNDDGVGCYWRDYPKVKTGEEKHLARIMKSHDMARLERSYDRMLIHFRKATKGEGTHPFICRDRQDLKSGNWLLVHNGCVQDTNARLMLRDKHIMTTEIDSEVFIHIWADINESNLEKRAKKFTEKVKEMDITGWANLIFYNFVTDEWVAMAESALGISKTKDGDIIVVSSDKAWLDEAQAKKLGIKFDEMPYGSIAYGKGTTYKTKAHVWKVKSQTQITSYYQDAGNGTYRKVFSDADIWDLGGGVQNAEAWELQQGQGVMPSECGRVKGFSSQNYNKAIANGAHWDAKMRAMVDKKGRPLDFDTYSDPSDHSFVPSGTKDDSGMATCDVCMMSLPYHKILQELNRNRAAEQTQDQLEDQYDKWDKRHPFTRDFNYPTIQCMCGTKSSFSVLHLAHEFKKLGGSDYCQDCGQSRAVGNHKEDGPETHFYQDMKIEDEDPKSGRRFYTDSGSCGRCGFSEAMHPMNDLNRQKREVVVIKQRPMGCDCRPKAGLVCTVHHKQGFGGFDQNGMLVKETCFDMGNN
jgi:predicted glutamine amidotransferase